MRLMVRISRPLYECDVCGKPGERWAIRRHNQTKPTSVDLCPAHEGPLLEVLEVRRGRPKNMAGRPILTPEQARKRMEAKR